MRGKSVDSIYHMVRPSELSFKLEYTHYKTVLICYNNMFICDSNIVYYWPAKWASIVFLAGVCHL